MTNLRAQTPGGGDRVALCVQRIGGCATRSIGPSSSLQLHLIAATLVEGHVMEVLLASGLNDGLVLEFAEKHQFKSCHRMSNDQNAREGRERDFQSNGKRGKRTKARKLLKEPRKGNIKKKHLIVMHVI